VIGINVWALDGMRSRPILRRFVPRSAPSAAALEMSDADLYAELAELHVSARVG
jgi:hypothetical protein